ncbi:hypothetical protein C2E31_00035 [Rhodopirellula baltica]|nr:hypothetical protein C2E31_00035 [Rhodopirellula baltica]
MLVVIGFNDVQAQSNDPFGNSPATVTTQKNQVPSARPVTATNSVAIAAQDANIRDKQFKSDSELRIRAALNELTSQNFIDVPMIEAAQQLSQVHDIPIVIDRRALDEVGADEEIPVSINLKAVKLRSFLRLMLSDLDLTYVIKDDVLQFTTRSAAEHALSVELYSLRGELAAKGKEVAEMVTRVIVPGFWEANHGPGSVIPLDHVIVVSATSDVHYSVEQFLQRLELAHASNKADE